MNKIIHNYSNNLTGTLVPLDKPLTQIEIDQLHEIFNSPEVYKWLFLRKLNDKEFTHDNITNYVNWSIKEWQLPRSRNFLLISDDKIIYGGGDLQKLDDTTVTLGFWSNPKYPGFATNMVKELINIARKLHYKIIDAYCEQGNVKPLKVLERNNFEFIENIQKDGYILLKYQIISR